MPYRNFSEIKGKLMRDIKNTQYGDTLGELEGDRLLETLEKNKPLLEVLHHKPPPIP